MRLLSIETSCDETAISLLDCLGDEQSATFQVLSHALLSQIEIHREFGGVYPAVAKREHAKNLVPLLQIALEEAELFQEVSTPLADDIRTRIGELLAREADMADSFLALVTETARPDIDAIAVTYGPGLAPALWVGVSFAQALALAWNVPLVPVNHMEGHFMSALAKRGVNEDEKDTLVISELPLRILGLLISGGHTEIDLMHDWLSYELLGQTLDDAVGEAFDKVARMMNLPYPGGPEISMLAEKIRRDRGSGAVSTTSRITKLPRPMLADPSYNFSFSGLKTAVLYQIKALGALSEQDSEELALEFEEAVADVLVGKTCRALEATGAQLLAIGGGVSANPFIRRRFEERLAADFPYVELRYPPEGLTGDNAIMIGLAGYYHFLKGEFTEPGMLVADGNLSLSALKAV
jgi:N6-L-threonylcarbamoyladenine synthase